MKIAVIGATGEMGLGLAMRLSMAGHEVVIGSRDAARAREAADRAAAEHNCTGLRGAANEEAAAWAEVVVISVPAAGHKATVEGLKDILVTKPVIDITIPMAFNPLRYAPPAEGSNALEAQAVLGEGCRLAAGFHTVSAKLLVKTEQPLSGSTFIVGNDEDTVSAAMELAASIGLQPVNAGGLQFAHTVESLTRMLLGVNKRYDSNCAGIVVTGINL